MRDKGTPQWEFATARTALQEMWRNLAPVLDDARQVTEAARKDPKLLNDPALEAQIRWLKIFDRELTAVETICQALEYRGPFGGRVRLSVEDMRAARVIGQRLADIAGEGQRRVAQRQNPTEPPLDCIS